MKDNQHEVSGKNIPFYKEKYSDLSQNLIKLFIFSCNLRTLVIIIIIIIIIVVVIVVILSEFTILIKKYLIIECGLGAWNPTFLTKSPSLIFFVLMLAHEKLMVEILSHKVLLSTHKKLVVENLSHKVGTLII